MDFKYFLNYLNRCLEELVGINSTKIGLDLEPSSAALVQLSGSFSSPKLTRASIQKMPAGTMTDEFIQNTRSLSEAVSQLLEKTGAKKKSNISIAAPGSLVITKKVQLKEGLTPVELNTFAWNEARKAFPGLADNLYLDYLPLEENKLLLVAARKKELQERLNAIASSGLQVEAIDIDYYALARAYPLVKHQLTEDDQKGYVALVNIDSSAMLLDVMHLNELVFFHRQSYNASFPVNNEGAPLALSEATNELLGTQIKRLLQFFQTDFPGHKINQALVCGRIAIIPGVRELIENAINIPTQLANPLYSLQGSTALKHKLEQQAPIFMLSIGLAMRGLRT